MILRPLRIIWVVTRYRLDTLLPLEKLPWWLRLIFTWSPLKLIPVGERSRGERLRLALESLGPIFVKFGQMLSTRRDLFPDDIANELKRLQDQVPPFPGEQAEALIEESLGEPLEVLFAEFSREPLASASIAQVHTARLPDGQDVVVKVIRPGIERVMRQDMALMYLVARALNKVPEARRLHPVEVVRDYETTLFDELDLTKEAANTSQLKRNFDKSPLLYVPSIHWPLTRHKVMVQERIHGVPVADIEALKAQGTDLKRLAERGVEIFFTQVFRDSFFHADMHPGNIFISRKHPWEPQYIAIDFGIVGSLTPEDQSYLARNLMAFFKRDYRRVAQLHIDSGWVPADTRVNEFEAAIRSVCEPIFERPLKDISFGQLLLRLFQTARRFNMEVQPQLVLLQKTLLNIEGLGRQLYPDLDLWSTGQPYLERWMRERMLPQNQVKHWQQHLERVPALIDSAHRALDNLADAPLREQAPQRPRWPLQLAGIALVVFGASALGGDDPQLWLHAAPTQWALIALGGWLILRRR